MKKAIYTMIALALLLNFSVTAHSAAPIITQNAVKQAAPADQNLQTLKFTGKFEKETLKNNKEVIEFVSDKEVRYNVNAKEGKLAEIMKLADFMKKTFVIDCLVEEPKKKGRHFMLTIKEYKEIETPADTAPIELKKDEKKTGPLEVKTR